MTRHAIRKLADEELMELVHRKDAAAFEVLFDRHGGAAYSLAHRVLGDTTTAEDVTQEAFLSIWRSGARFDSARGGVRSWILGIARNRSIDALRRNARPARRLDFDDEQLLEARPAAERTDAEALRRETARELQGALGALPTEQSRVLELAYYGGFTQSEIAEMLDTPLGTVKGRMRLGLESLRGWIGEQVR